VPLVQWHDWPHRSCAVDPARKPRWPDDLRDVRSPDWVGERKGASQGSEGSSMTGASSIRLRLIRRLHGALDHVVQRAMEGR